MKLPILVMALSLASAAQAQSEKAVVEAAEAAVAAARAAAQSATDAASDSDGPSEESAAAYSGYFDPSRDGMADIDAALVEARFQNRHVLLILGGDWCHDSEALNDVLNIPRTREMVDARYVIVRVHVPYSQSERVLPVAQRFGIAEVEGTPTVLILRPEGTPTNLADAPSWRNAASRKPAAIHRALERAAPAAPQ